MRYLLGLLLIVALAAGGAFVYAGRLPGPAIEITKPVKYVGQSAPVEVAVTAPGAKLTRLEVVFEQNGKQTPIASLAQPASAEIKQDGPDKVRVTRLVNDDPSGVCDLLAYATALLVGRSCDEHSLSRTHSIQPKGPVRNKLITVAADPSRLAALLVGHMHPAFSLLAPCDRGASAPTVINLFLTGP